MWRFSLRLLDVLFEAIEAQTTNPQGDKSFCKQTPHQDGQADTGGDFRSAC